MRKTILAVAIALAMAPAGVAWAHGPSGSFEESGTTYTNNVTCNRSSGPSGSGANVYVSQLSTGAYAGANGAETCKDGNGVAGLSTIQGRIIVSTTGYVSADGDRDNPEQLRGWLRLDSSGPRCGDDAGRLDSSHPEGTDTSADCQS